MESLTRYLALGKTVLDGEGGEQKQKQQKKLDIVVVIKSTLLVHWVAAFTPQREYLRSDMVLFFSLLA